MTRKQRIASITSLVNHARLMLSTEAGLRPGADEYRDDYLRWAEMALERAAEQVGEMLNTGGTKKIGFSLRKVLTL